MKNLFLAGLFCFMSVVAQAQYTQIAKANDTVSIVGSVTTVARYGSVKDNLWFYKAYSSKMFVVNSKEFTVSPDPSADPSTFVLQVFQLPKVSNFAAPTILVNGTAVVIPPPTAVIAPAPFSGPVTMNLTCVATDGVLNCK